MKKSKLGNWIGLAVLSSLMLAPMSARADGNTSGGGGSRKGSEFFDSYIAKRRLTPESHPVYKKMVEPTIARIEKADPALGAALRAALRKPWYLVPEHLPQMTSEETGIPKMFKLSQAVYQSDSAVWVDSRWFESRATTQDDIAAAFLHEAFQGARLELENKHNRAMDPENVWQMTTAILEGRCNSPNQLQDCVQKNSFDYFRVVAEWEQRNEEKGAQINSLLAGYRDRLRDVCLNQKMDLLQRVPADMKVMYHDLLNRAGMLPKADLYVRGERDLSKIHDFDRDDLNLLLAKFSAMVGVGHGYNYMDPLNGTVSAYERYLPFKEMFNDDSAGLARAEMCMALGVNPETPAVTTSSQKAVSIDQGAMSGAQVQSSASGSSEAGAAR